MNFDTPDFLRSMHSEKLTIFVLKYFLNRALNKKRPYFIRILTASEFFKCLNNRKNIVTFRTFCFTCSQKVIKSSMPSLLLKLWVMKVIKDFKVISLYCKFFVFICDFMNTFEKLRKETICGVFFFSNFIIHV